MGRCGVPDRPPPPEPPVYQRPAPGPLPPLEPCPTDPPGAPVGTEGLPYDPTHPAAGCPGPPGVPCPCVEDTGPGPGNEDPPCPQRPGLETSTKIGHHARWEPDQATEGILRRVKYETLPDHLQDVAFSEILESDRWKSTAIASFTMKSRDLCLNPEPIFSPAPPLKDVTYLKDMEERVRASTLLPSRPRFSEYGEAYHPKRLAVADMVGRWKLKKMNEYKPSTDILPKHFYTAKTGVAGEVNPYLSTTQKHYQAIPPEKARWYRDKPPGDINFTGDQIIPPEPAMMPRWHFTPAVPNNGLKSEVQAQFCRPRLDELSRHNWSVPVATPLAVPPTTHQLYGDMKFDQEYRNYGTGRHNPVAKSCAGLVTQQKYRKELCNIEYDPLLPRRPPCLPTGPLAMRGNVGEVEMNLHPISEKTVIQDNHFGICKHPPPPPKPETN